MAGGETRPYEFGTCRKIERLFLILLNRTDSQKLLIPSAALNFEDKSSYTFTITVSDETLTDTITVTINVTDANDAPIFTGESTLRSVAENTATGNITLKIYLCLNNRDLFNFENT
jgi:hypothetical protein